MASKSSGPPACDPGQWWQPDKWDDPDFDPFQDFMDGVGSFRNTLAEVARVSIVPAFNAFAEQVRKCADSLRGMDMTNMS